MINAQIRSLARHALENWNWDIDSAHSWFEKNGGKGLSSKEEMMHLCHDEAKYEWRKLVNGTTLESLSEEFSSVLHKLGGLKKHLRDEDLSEAINQKKASERIRKGNTFSGFQIRDRRR